MNYLYEDGNRLAVPAAVSGPHFLYKACSPELDELDLNALMQAVMKHVDQHGLLPGNICGMGREMLEAAHHPAGEAFDRLITALGTTEEQRFRAGVLACEWASPHVDDTYEGNAFLSYVMHTGPEPYVMQSFHTSVSGGSYSTQKITTSTRVLSRGDTFVFDPTTAHMVVPRRPESGQLLVLLQIVIDESNAEDRSALLGRHPPKPNDEDENNVFQGY